MAAKIIRGYVVSRINRDNDAIINLICPFGFLSFFATGVNKPNSKNNVSLQLGNFIECELFLSRSKEKMSKLKKSVILEQFNFNSLNSISFLEAIKFSKYIDQNNTLIFKSFETFMKNLDYNPNYSLTWFLYEILVLLGYLQFNDRCVECGSNQKIIELDLYKGGFLCKNHNKKVTNINILKNFSYLGKDIKKYLEYANDYGDKELRSILKEFIISVIIV